MLWHCLRPLLVLLVVTHVGAANSSLGHFQQAQEVDQLISQLGHADPAVREAAMRALWSHGESAAPALRTALDSPDPEVAGRAELLLSRLRHGIEPEAPASLVRLIMQARESASSAERAQARVRLTAVQSGAAKAIALMIVEALEPLGEPLDPPQAVIAQLWPADPWALARVNDELSRIDNGRFLTQWLERAAEQSVSPWAAPAFAQAARYRNELEAATLRWRSRVEAEPSPQSRLILACLLFAADDPEAAELLCAEGETALSPVVWAMLDNNFETARQLAIHPDEITRHTLALLLARASGDVRAETESALLIRQWLQENSDDLARALRDVGEEVEPGVVPAPVAQVLRAMLAALLAGDLPTCFALASEIDAAGLVRLHYRRLEFDLGAQVVVRHTQRQGDQARAVQLTQRRMREELEMQVRRGMPSLVLSGYARLRIAALDAAHAGDWAAAADKYSELVAIDDSDPAVRWAWGRALVASGERARGEEQLNRALFMPLANPWVARVLAGEMRLLGDSELALTQLRESARWSTLVPPDSLAVLQTLADCATDAQRYDESARALAAAMIMLMDEQVYAQLGDRALYFAFSLAAEMERARMNQSAAAGDWVEAQASLARSLAYMPQTEAAIDLIHALDVAGHTELADRIFLEAFAPIATAAGRYSQSSLLCNQAAWIAASCSRRLDTALHLAQSAVNSDPASPAALDTLAEVYLRRGQPERAVELLERILALAEAQDSVGTYQASQFLNYLKRRREFLDRIEAAE